MQLTQEKALSMLELQAAMNCKVNPDWHEAGSRSCAPSLLKAPKEWNIMDGSGGKRKPPILRNCKWRSQMEIVDIWHFILSDAVIKAKGSLTYAASAITQSATKPHLTGSIQFDGNEYYFSEMDTIRKLEFTIGLAVARRVSIPLFASLLADCGLTWGDLYRQYIAKNILNFFRQDHGYKEDKYRKTWAGREDNEHLVELLSECDPDRPEFKAQLYEGLRLRYLETAEV